MNKTNKIQFEDDVISITNKCEFPFFSDHQKFESIVKCFKNKN